MRETPHELLRAGFGCIAKTFARRRERFVRGRGEILHPLSQQLFFVGSRMNALAAGVRHRLGGFSQQQRIGPVGAIDERRQRQAELFNLRRAGVLRGEMQPRGGRDAVLRMAAAAPRLFQNRIQLRREECRIGRRGLCLDPRRRNDHEKSCQCEQHARHTRVHSAGSSFMPCKGAPRGRRRPAHETNTFELLFWKVSTACGVTFVSVR